MSIRENEKFRKAANDDSSGKPHSLKDFVSDIKGTFGLKYAAFIPIFPPSDYNITALSKNARIHGQYNILDHHYL